MSLKGDETPQPAWSRFVAWGTDTATGAETDLAIPIAGSLGTVASAAAGALLYSGEKAGALGGAVLSVVCFLLATTLHPRAKPLLKRVKELEDTVAKVEREAEERGRLKGLDLSAQFEAQVLGIMETGIRVSSERSVGHVVPMVEGLYRSRVETIARSGIPSCERVILRLKTEKTATGTQTEIVTRKQRMHWDHDVLIVPIMQDYDLGKLPADGSAAPTVVKLTVGADDSIVDLQPRPSCPCPKYHGKTIIRSLKGEQAPTTSQLVCSWEVRALVDNAFVLSAEMGRNKWGTDEDDWEWKAWCYYQEVELSLEWPSGFSSSVPRIVHTRFGRETNLSPRVSSGNNGEVLWSAHLTNVGPEDCLLLKWQVH